MKKMDLKATFLIAVAATVVQATAASFAATARPKVVTNDYHGVKCVVNYDESRVGPYSLEDPLTFVDGRDCDRVLIQPTKHTKSTK